MTRQIETEITFASAHEFHAVRSAEHWCADHGYSVGEMQRGSPRGLLAGDYAVAKWRNLTIAEREQLDGVMEGDMRHGPVTVKIFTKGGE